MSSIDFPTVRIKDFLFHFAQSFEFKWIMEKELKKKHYRNRISQDIDNYYAEHNYTGISDMLHKIGDKTIWQDFQFNFSSRFEDEKEKCLPLYTKIENESKSSELSQSIQNGLITALKTFLRKRH